MGAIDAVYLNVWDAPSPGVAQDEDSDGTQVLEIPNDPVCVLSP
jgi:hypothetical protein